MPLVCPSSGELIVSIRHLLYVTLCRWPSGMHVWMETTRFFFVYIYFYSVHVSGSHVSIIRTIIVSIRPLLYVTLCRWPSGMHVWMETTRFFFVYIYFYSVHVLSSHVSIIRTIIVSIRTLLYVTLCRWPSGMQVSMETARFFFVYIYFYSVHVSGSFVSITRKNCINTTSGLCHSEN